jgi:hypothetical protein
MSKGIIDAIAGGLMVAAGAALTVVTGGIAAAISPYLIQAGAGLVLSGIGTMLTGNVHGFATTERNPIAPWQIVLGQTRVGGTLIYVTEFGNNNRFLDMIIVLAAHPSFSVDTLKFDGQRVTISQTNNTSYSPATNDDYNIPSTSDIVRLPTPQGNCNVATVSNVKDIPSLLDGDYVVIQGVEPSNTLLNGRVQVFDVFHDLVTGKLQFSYLSGGPPTSGSGSVPVTASGQVKTQWQNYANNVYIESINDGIGIPEYLANPFILGTSPLWPGGNIVELGPWAPFNRHRVGPPNNPTSFTPTTLGDTFYGQLYGTPLQGDYGNIIQNAGEGVGGVNPWSANCSLVGYTAVMLRLQYDSNYFPAGIPQVTFIMRGKADISDPRTSPPTVGFTRNAALLIADYLQNTLWGFNALSTEIDQAALIAAANVCDEQVDVAVPLTSPYTTENRYMLNGHFDCSMRRGEVLQNLLTSCAGRITYTNGMFQIWPAAWYGSSPTVFTDTWMKQNMAGPIRWRSSVIIRNRYNGVRGTYISPSNNWNAADFPYYAQDENHGYNDGPPEYQYDQNLANDEGQRRWKSIQLPFTIGSNMAQRLAKIELLRSIWMGTGTFPMNMAGYQIAPLDILQVSLDYFGWTSKYLEVAATRFKIEKNSDKVILLGTEIDVQETDPSIYDWALIEDLTPQGYAIPGVPNAVYTPDPPSNLNIAGGILTWTAPNDAYVVTIAGRYMAVQSPPGLWISLGQVPVSVTQMELPGLEDGVTYIVELQSINGAGVTSQWVSIITVGEPEFQWAPYQVQALSSDALFPNEWTFGLSQAYTPTSGTDWLAVATVTGVQPINQFIANSTAPVIALGNVFVSSTGGSIPGGSTVYLAIGALDAGGNPVPGSIILSVAIPSGTNTNSITLGDAYATITGTFVTNPTDGVPLTIAGNTYVFQDTVTLSNGVLIGSSLAASIANLYAAINTAGGSCAATASTATTITCTAVAAGTAGNSLTATGIATWSNTGSFAGGASIAWPLVPGLTTYVIFASLNEEDLICAQATGALTQVGSPPTAYTPTTGLSLPGPLARSTWGYPYPSTAKVRVKGALLIHGGVEGAEVDAVSNVGSYTILAGECADIYASPPVDNWVGRVLAIIGRNNGAGPYASFNITGFDAYTGLFTLSEDPVAAGVEVGDALVVCTLGVDNSGNPYVITDPGLSNAQDEPTPHTGLTPDDPALLGATVLVIKGTSRGLSAHITGNGATSLTLDAPIPIDSTSVWIVMGSTWLYQNDSVPIANSIYTLPVAIPMTVSNAVGGSVLVACFTVDDEGNESFLADAPVRMVFIWGAGMAEVLVGSTGSPPATEYQMLSTDQVVEVDASGGPFTVILPDISVVRNSPRFITKVDSSANIVTIQGYNGQTVGYLTTYTLKNQGDAAELLPTGS